MDPASGASRPWETLGIPTMTSPSINGHTKDNKGQSTARPQGWESSQLLLLGSLVQER